MHTYTGLGMKRGLEKVDHGKRYCRYCVCWFDKLLIPSLVLVYFVVHTVLLILYVLLLLLWFHFTQTPDF